MNPTTLRYIGIGFLIASAVVAVLNLKRTANLGAIFLPTALFVIGMASILRARKRRL